MAIRSAKFGCLNAALIATWTVVGVIIMAAGFLAVGVLDPNQVADNRIWSVPPLIGLVVAFVGSVLSIERDPAPRP